VYESLQRTPEELLLFFHHVPYTYVLRSGKTVIQHIYDEHYKGAEDAEQFVARWRRLERLIDDERYARVLAKLEYQAGHAIVWRDAVNGWFLRMSGIADASGRAGNFPNRVEVESMRLEGFAVEPVVPWETASGALAVVCESGRSCTARHHHTGAAGSYDLAVQYFDENDGASRLRLLVSGKEIDAWSADADLPSPKPNGHTSTRRTLRGVRLTPGDEIRVEATGAREEAIAVDYVEIVRRDSARPGQREAPR
jgi:alpha-glucuronidase